METVILSKYSIDIGKVPFDTIHKESITISDPDAVHYWWTPCNCTTVNIDGNNIEITFDVQAGIGGVMLKQGEEKTADKWVDLHLDKDLPHFVPDKTTRYRKPNPLKRSFRIPINFIAHG